MKADHAQEFTEALGQVFAGAVRLVDVATDIGVPKALGLSPAEWAERRLAGHVKLSIAERQRVVAELTEEGHSSRDIADALGVTHPTILSDRKAAGKDLPPQDDNDDENAAPAGKDLPERDRSAMFTSDRDDWETPQDLFDDLNAEFGFELDVCATPRTAKCRRYYTPDDNALARKWQGICWMNPPYGDAIGEWVAKAAESANAGATVVCLVPARVDTGWWWDYCRHGEVRFLRGRLRFDNSSSGAPFPSVVVVLGRPARVVWWER